MYHFIPDNDDLDEFAKYLGFEGLDSDLFYENYYGLNEDCYDDIEAFEPEASYDPWSVTGEVSLSLCAGRDSRN